MRSHQVKMWRGMEKEKKENYVHFKEPITQSTSNIALGNLLQLQPNHKTIFVSELRKYIALGVMGIYSIFEDFQGYIFSIYVGVVIDF